MTKSHRKLSCMAHYPVPRPTFFTHKFVHLPRNWLFNRFIDSISLIRKHLRHHRAPPPASDQPANIPVENVCACTFPFLIRFIAHAIRHRKIYARSISLLLGRASHQSRITMRREFIFGIRLPLDGIRIVFSTRITRTSPTKKSDHFWLSLSPSPPTGR